MTGKETVNPEMVEAATAGMEGWHKKRRERRWGNALLGVGAGLTLLGLTAMPLMIPGLLAVAGGLMLKRRGRR